MKWGAEIEWRMVRVIGKFFSSSNLLDTLASSTSAYTNSEQQVEFQLGLIFRLALVHWQRSLHQVEKVLKDVKTIEKEEVSVDRWTIQSKELEEIVDRVNHLVTVPTFVSVVSQLLSHPSGATRNRSLLLLNERLSQDRDKITDKEVILFVDLANNLLTNIIKPAQQTQVQNTQTQQQQTNQTPAKHDDDIAKQTAVLSLEILTRNFGSSFPEKFANFVPIILSVIPNANSQMLGSLMLCIATFV